MTPAQYQLLAILQSGPCSGPSLGQQLQVSRAAIWKLMDQLRQQGIAIVSDQQGYRLPSGFHLLDATKIQQQLNNTEPSAELSVAVLPHTDSTNSELWKQAESQRHGSVLLAESQSAGRGRRGRQWHSPPCSNLYFSFGWTFDCGVGALGLLSTQVAVACAQAVEQACQITPQLKWPNDLYLAGKKVGGILIELQATPDGPSSAVIGIGLNVAMPADAPIDQAFTSLDQHSQQVDRNIIAATLAQQLAQSFSPWPPKDPQTLLEHWQRYDMLREQAIEIHTGSGIEHAQYAGIDTNGGLHAHINGQERVFHSGEVSIRRA